MTKQMTRTAAARAARRAQGEYAMAERLRARGWRAYPPDWTAESVSLPAGQVGVLLSPPLDDDEPRARCCGEPLRLIASGAVGHAGKRGCPNFLPV